MDTRTCSACGEDKPLDSFTWRKREGVYRRQCKSCRKTARHLRYQKNKERVLAQSREYYAQNTKQCRQARRAYYQRNRSAYKKRALKWYRNNPEKAAEMARNWRQTEYGALRTALDSLRKRVRGVSESRADLPYSAEQLRQRLEMNMQAGMTWANYGSEWHIDHKKPVRRFYEQGISDPAIVNALSNLRPMWAADNLKKGSRFD